MKESSSRPEDAANSLILSSPYYYSSCNSYIKRWFDCVWGWRRQNQWDENEEKRIEWIAGVSSSTVKENEGRKRGYSSGNGIARPIGRGERSIRSIRLRGRRKRRAKIHSWQGKKRKKGQVKAMELWARGVEVKARSQAMRHRGEGERKKERLLLNEWKKELWIRSRVEVK